MVQNKQARNQAIKQGSDILGLQSISRVVAHNASHTRRLDPTMELMKYSFVLYLQHGRHESNANHQ